MQGYGMRRILNLNQPSTVFVKIIGIFIVLIPAVLYCAILLLNNTTIASMLLGVIKVSLAIGAFAAAILLILIIIEQIQDHYFDVHYQKNRSQKRLLANGNYECQYCGNQKLKESDKICLVCGKELK